MGSQQPSCTQSSVCCSDCQRDGPCSITACEAPERPRHGFLSVLPRKREVVRQFTPSWFTVTMGTASVSITVAMFPFSFSGQQAIGWALWWLTVLLFILFSCLLLGRLLFFCDTMPKLFQHCNQSLFMGAIPMSFSTLTNGVVLLWVPRFGAAASAVAHAMFYINLPAVLGCIILVPLTMFTVHKHGLDTMSAVWLLPVVPACVAANTAGVVAKSMTNPDHAVSVLYIGVCLLGIGFLLSYQICTIYYTRLTCFSLPAKEVIVSSFLPVGPMAMTAWAFMNLSAAARQQLVAYYQHHPDLGMDIPWLQDTVAPLWVAASGALGMFLWGFATWWLLLACSCVSSTLHQGIPFNLGWWGSVFPMGVYTGATIQLARVSQSQTFAVLGAISVCVHVVLWLVVVSLTGVRAYNGQLFHAPCLAQSDAAAVVQSPSAAEALEKVEVQLSQLLSRESDAPQQEKQSEADASV